jgi:hypothetical protein
VTAAQEDLIQELIRDEPFFSDETEVFRTPPSTPKLNGSSRESSLNSFIAAKNKSGTDNGDAQNEQNTDCLKVSELMELLKASEEVEQSDETSGSSPPAAPPRRRDRSKNLLARKGSVSPPRVGVNGLPPTPKVHMGACFTKVFNECPLKILCSASWIHPETRDQHILLGCEEGLYTLNLNELHDACIDQLFPRRTAWIFVIKDILMSLSGKTQHLYRHDLVQLHAMKTSLSNNSSKFGAQVDNMINRIPDRFVPWKMSATAKIADTKGCQRCCVGRNPYNGYKYLCGVSGTTIFLMQWYNPLNKFMLLKVCILILAHILLICASFPPRSELRVLSASAGQRVRDDDHS